MGARTLAATMMSTNDLQFCELRKVKKQLRSVEGSKLIDKNVNLLLCQGVHVRHFHLNITALHTFNSFILSMRQKSLLLLCRLEGILSYLLMISKKLLDRVGKLIH